MNILKIRIMEYRKFWRYPLTNFIVSKFQMNMFYIGRMDFLVRIRVATFSTFYLIV